MLLETLVLLHAIGDCISTAQSSRFGAGGASFRTGVRKGMFVDTLAFGAYQRDVFLDNGGYDEELIRNQDEEFNFRLIQYMNNHRNTD